MRLQTIVQCGNQRQPSVAETSVVIFPGSPKPPALQLPRLDLGRLLGSQGATLATVQQAQTVLVEAAQAIARLQHRCLTAAAARAALAVRQPPPAAVLKDGMPAAEQGVAVTREIMAVATAARRRAAELLAQRAQAAVAELEAIAA